MKNYNLQLTKEQKTERLALFLSIWTDDCISKLTSNLDYKEQILNDNTIMYLLNEWYNYKTARLNNINVALNAPFENEFITYNKFDQLTDILYNLIIKEDS